MYIKIDTTLMKHGCKREAKGMQKGGKRDEMCIEGDAMYIKMDTNLIKNRYKREAMKINIETTLMNK